MSERGEELFMTGETLHAMSMDSRVVTEHDAERFHAVGMNEGARSGGRRRAAGGLNEFHWAYSVASPLLVYDDDTLVQLSSSEGVRQGDPFAAFVFACNVCE
jgi:hypothetical protein